MKLDSSTEFLLKWQFENFFSIATFRPGETDFLCKGCGEVVPQWNRKKHFEAHKKDRAMILEANRMAAQLNQERGGNGDTRYDVCVSCGSEFEQPRRRGRPRKKCYECLPEGA